MYLHKYKFTEQQYYWMRLNSIILLWTIIYIKSNSWLWGIRQGIQARDGATFWVNNDILIYHTDLVKRNTVKYSMMYKRLIHFSYLFPSFTDQSKERHNLCGLATKLVISTNLYQQNWSSRSIPSKKILH